MGNTSKDRSRMPQFNAKNMSTSQLAEGAADGDGFVIVNHPRPVSDSTGPTDATPRGESEAGDRRPEAKAAAAGTKAPSPLATVQPTGLLTAQALELLNLMEGQCPKYPGPLIQWRNTLGPGCIAVPSGCWAAGHGSLACHGDCPGTSTARLLSDEGFVAAGDGFVPVEAGEDPVSDALAGVGCVFDETACAPYMYDPSLSLDPVFRSSPKKTMVLRGGRHGK